jgi:hypothetical protein
VNFTGQFNIYSPDILLEPMELGNTRNRHNPGFLRQEPCQGNLGRRCIFTFCNLPDQINKHPVRFSVFRRKSWNGVPEIARIKNCVLCNFSCEKTFPERREWDKSNPGFFQDRQYFFLRLPPPQGIFTLQGGNGLNGVGTADGSDPGLGKAKMIHLTLLKHKC